LFNSVGIDERIGEGDRCRSFPVPVAIIRKALMMALPISSEQITHQKTSSDGLRFRLLIAKKSPPSYRGISELKLAINEVELKHDYSSNVIISALLASLI
jgi:hypothetical protein